eukprot:7463995-Pyramimonas_sp.AAC.1
MPSVCGKRGKVAKHNPRPWETAAQRDLFGAHFVAQPPRMVAAGWLDEPWFQIGSREVPETTVQEGSETAQERSKTPKTASMRPTRPP